MQPCRVVSLIPRTSRGWSQQELAEFHRVGDILRQVGWGIETEQGHTDEGDPWFVFCDEASGSVIAHFAKVNGRFVLASSVLDVPVEGASFSNIVGRFLSQYPMVVSAPKANGSTLVFAHPVAALGGIVATLAAAQAIDRFEFTEAREDGREPTGLARSLAALADFVAGRTAGRPDRVDPTFSKSDGVVVATAAVAFMHSLVVLNDDPAVVDQAVSPLSLLLRQAEVALSDLVAANDGPTLDNDRVDVSLNVIASLQNESSVRTPASVSPDLQVEAAGERSREAIAAQEVRFEAADIAFRWDPVLAMDDSVDVRALGSVVEANGGPLPGDGAMMAKSAKALVAVVSDESSSVANASPPMPDLTHAAPLSASGAVTGSSQWPMMALPDAFLAIFGQPATWQTDVTMLSPTSEAARRVTDLDSHARALSPEPVALTSAPTVSTAPATLDAAGTQALTTAGAGHEFDKLLAFVSAAGPILLLVANSDIYLVDRDALGLSDPTQVMSVEVELSNGSTVHLIGMADVFATADFFI